jgi:hypothetical protein
MWSDRDDEGELPPARPSLLAVTLGAAVLLVALAALLAVTFS